MGLLKKFSLGFLILLLLFFLYSCGENHTKKLSPHQKTEEEQATEIEQERGIEKRAGIGRGQGGPGRGRWRRTQEQVLEISPESAKMIDIKVKPAVMKSMGSYISATGMVKTNENKVAIVGPLFSGRIKEFFEY